MTKSFSPAGMSSLKRRIGWRIWIRVRVRSGVFSRSKTIKDFSACALRSDEMVLHYKIRAFGHAEGKSFGKNFGCPSTAHPPSAIESPPARDAAETGLRALLRLLVNASIGIGEVQHVMHHRFARKAACR